MARRRTSKHTSGGKNYVWTVVRIGRALSTTVSSDILVADADWNSNASQNKATILAVRGYLNFRSIGTSDADCKYYIGTQDEDLTVLASPDTAGTYVDEDIMYTNGIGKGAGAVEAVQLYLDVFNIKAKRKLRTGMELRLIARASANSQIQVAGIIRTLLLLNNS